MQSKKTFQVKNPPIIFNMCICMVLIFLGMELAYVFTTPQPHPAILISMTVFFIIPFSVGGVWAKRYCIKVNGTSISLQRSFRIEPVCFDVSEITKAVCLVTQTRMGENIKIIAHTSKYGKFSVATMMVNSDKMKKYLEEYASHKIQTIQKKIGV